MPFVNVPVPEENVLEVMQYVIRLINRANIEDWDDESITEFFRGSDEPSRSLMSVVARAVMAGKELTEQQAADFIQLSGRETLGILREVNDNAKDANRPGPIVTLTVTEELPNGKTREKRCLTMSPVHARMVRAAERELHMDESSPLESGIG
jgi:hypothetical protein